MLSKQLDTLRLEQKVLNVVSMGTVVCLDVFVPSLYPSEERRQEHDAKLYILIQRESN